MQLVDVSGLADELIEAPVCSDALATIVDVDSARLTRRVAVEANPEPNGFPCLPRAP